MAEEETALKLTKETEGEERQRIPTSAPETPPSTADAITPREHVHAEEARLQGNTASEPRTSGSSSPHEDGGHVKKPSVSYVALISQVILASGSQKLNLASIYEAMEDRFPYFRSHRGQGWRNSVRHNLSVNDCFVKLSRCEDGKGHYWGIHPAHLCDFQQGNFRQHRHPRRGSREAGTRGSTDEPPGRTEPDCLRGGFCRIGPRSLGWVEPRHPLHGHSGYGPPVWPEPRYHRGRFGVGRAEPPGGVRPYYAPDSPPYYHDTAMAGSWHHAGSLTPTWTLHSWGTCNPTPRGVRESGDGVFVRRPQLPLCLPGCQCEAPVYRDVIKPAPYYVNYFFHP